MAYIKTLFEDPNGDPDEITFGGFIALMVLCAVSIIQACQGKPVDLNGFGMGAAAIVVAVGGAKWGRDGHSKGDDHG